jgi:hypothetical protein
MNPIGVCYFEKSGEIAGTTVHVEEVSLWKGKSVKVRVRKRINQKWTPINKRMGNQRRFDCPETLRKISKRIDRGFGKTVSVGNATKHIWDNLSKGSTILQYEIQRNHTFFSAIFKACGWFSFYL